MTSIFGHSGVVLKLSVLFFIDFNNVSKATKSLRTVLRRRIMLISLDIKYKRGLICLI